MPRSAADFGAPRIKAFFVGPTGSGKTTLAATFPDPYFMVPVNEKSIETLAGRDDVLYDYLGEERHVIANTNKLLDELTLASKQQVTDEETGEVTLRLYRDFGQTIVSESLSHYQDLVIGELEKETKDGRQMWGKWRNHLMHIRDQLLKLPAHIIFTSLDDQKTDDTGKVREHSPLISGAARTLLPSSCNIVGFCEQTATNPPQWRTHICQYGKFPGRSRLPGLPNATYAGFTFETIRQHVKGL